ncbi:MAG: methylated-DNA--[protein]-cysteine S-methyltransferase [Chlorobi bacterium]|nr:methylated-DNA--[protein]-cysteine S-methyltransferase [Chlorobiota bacterium]
MTEPAETAEQTSIAQITIASPVGFLSIQGTRRGVSSIRFVETAQPATPRLPAPVRDCAIQLEEYFAGKRREFFLRIDMFGTEFEQRVWQEVMHIPFGETRSYGEVAEVLGDAKVVRAVGQANAHNPLMILIPCHRVVAHDGALVGYAGGLHRKRWLLDHEAKASGMKLAL